MAISERDIPIPDHIDIFHLTEEIRASDKTPVQCVMEVDEERYAMATTEWFSLDRKRRPWPPFTVIYLEVGVPRDFLLLSWVCPP